VKSTVEHERIVLLHALKQIWAQNGTMVPFGMKFMPEAIEKIMGTWTVPVVCEQGDAPAYELSRALDRIQEELERSSSLPAVIILEPELD